MKRENYVFVYGSLMKGFHNHDIMEEGATFIKATKTKKKYRMVSMGSFPAVMKSQEDYHIYGEVYEVDDIAMEDLDALEGNGRFYQREKIRVEGFSKPVWIYFILEKGYYQKSFTEENIIVKNNVQRWNRR